MKIKILFSCILAVLLLSIGLNAQPQMEKWSIPPRLLKIDASSNVSSILLPTWTSGSPNASNAAFDLSGNLLFYVTDLEIYDPAGNSIGFISGNFLPDTKEIAIFKVPGECHQHYIVYPFFGRLYYSVIQDGPAGVSVVPGKDNVDCTGAGVFTFDVQIAVSRLRADGTRFLYATGAENLCKYVVTNQGITFNHEMLNTNSGPGLGLNFGSNELDLSHDGKKLAWGNFNTATQCDCDVQVVKLNANGNYNSIQSYLLPTAGMDVTGAEFGVSGDYLYVGSKRIWGGPGPGPSCPNAGINKIDLTQAPTSFINISANVNSHLEMARDGKIYASNNFGTALGALDLTTDQFTSNAITITCGKTLPDQIDGEDYQAEYGTPDFWISDGVDGWSTTFPQPVDDGIEPFSIKIEDAEIWNCENDPNCMANENPEYKMFGDNYFRVRVRNRGCSTSAPTTADLHMYWTRARSNELWDDHWIESPSNQIFGHTAGGEITVDAGGVSMPLDIPAIPPGGNVILTKEWRAPDPAWYTGDGNVFENLTLRPMICFLGRVKSSIDPFYLEAFGPIGPNVQNNNNIGTINTYMVNLNPINVHHWGGSIEVSLHPDQAGPVKVAFEAQEFGEHFGGFGTVQLHLSPELWEVWHQSGARAENIEIIDFNKRIVQIANPDAYAAFENLALCHDGIYDVVPGFFLNEGVTGEHNFTFRINMVDEETAEIGSGCTYKVHLGDECGINLQNQVSIERGSCIQIGEDAGCSACTYSWTPTYGLEDPTSPVTQACPSKTTTYQLTVVNEATGCEVTENVTVYVNEGNGNRSLSSAISATAASLIAEVKLFPNPANERFKVRLEAVEATSFPFSLRNNLGQTVLSHTLLATKGENTYNFEVNLLPSGSYYISIGNGEIWTETISIQH